MRVPAHRRALLFWLDLFFRKVWFGDADQLTREAGFASLGSGESSFFVNSDLRQWMETRDWRTWMLRGGVED